MIGVTVLEVVTAPEVRRFRLVGELVGDRVEDVVRALRIDSRPPGDVQLDLRKLTCRDGSAILLFITVAGLLHNGARLCLLFPQEPVLHLVDAFGIEGDLPNVRVVRRLSRREPGGHRPPADRLPDELPGFSPRSCPGSSQGASTGATRAE